MHRAGDSCQPLRPPANGSTHLAPAALVELKVSRDVVVLLQGDSESADHHAHAGGADKFSSVRATTTPAPYKMTTLNTTHSASMDSIMRFWKRCTGMRLATLSLCGRIKCDSVSLLDSKLTAP